jgi:hypothetical protein
MNQQHYVDLLKSDPNYRTWFKTWWEQDFSVEGCRARGVKCSGYHSPIAFAGRNWPFGRSPPHDLEGKANSNFAPINYSGTNGNVISSFDGDFRGAFFFGFQQQNLISRELDLRHAAVGGDIVVAGRPLGSLKLNNAFMEGAVRLDNANLSNGVDVSNARLAGLQISDCRGGFTGSRARVFGDLILTDDIQANLEHARCDGVVRVSGGVRGAGLACGRLHLSARPNRGNGDLTGAAIEGDLVLVSQTNGYRLTASNLSAGEIFLKDVTAEELVFSNLKAREVALSRATVQTIDFSGAHIATLKSEGAELRVLLLDDAAVSDSLNLDRSKLVRFEGGRLACGGKFTFRNGSVEQALSLVNAHFSAAVILAGTALGVDLDFRWSKFDAGLNLRGGAPEANSTLGRADFMGCEFKAGEGEICADFDRRQALDVVRFDLAHFEGLPNFFESALHENSSFDGAKFSIVPEAMVAEQEAPARPRELLASMRGDIANKSLSFPSLKTYWRSMQKARALESARMARYERAYNALRQRAEEINNAKYERVFHTYELRARRRRRDRDAPYVERVLSQIYDLTSEYGQSITRPLLCVLGLWALLGFVYWFVAGVITDAGLVEALQFSARQVIKPFSVWSRDIALPAVPGSGAAEAPDRWIVALLHVGNNFGDLLRTLLVQVLATLQSLASLALLFLSGLAIRRVFRL